MEPISIVIDNAAVFDAILQRSREMNVPECGDLKLVSKSGATKGGKAAVLITFTIEYKGERIPVQCVTTLENFYAAAFGLAAAHGLR